MEKIEKKPRKAIKAWRVLIPLLLVVALMYPCVYITPRKKVKIIDHNTKLPLSGVYVEVKQWYSPIATDFFTATSCDQIIRCGRTNKDGEVVFWWWPVIQSWGCRYSNHSFILYHPGYYYPVPWQVELSPRTTEFTYELLPYDKHYDPCSEWDGRLVYFFSWRVDGGFFGCKKMQEALKKKEAELPGLPCRIYGPELIEAAEKGDLVTVASILEKEPQLIDYQYRANLGPKDGTPLIKAIIGRHTDLINYLLDHGADVNVPDWPGATPLHHALRNSDWELAKRLIKMGADVNAADFEGVTPLHLAVQGEDVELFKILLEKGADPNAVDERGNTVLHKVIRSADITKLLLDHGADIKVKNKSGQSAFSHMVERGASNEVLELLLETGSDVNEVNRSGDSPLHYAAGYCHLETVKFLVAHGANTNKINNSGTSPCEARFGLCDDRSPIIRFLEQNGCVQDIK